MFRWGDGIPDRLHDGNDQFVPLARWAGPEEIWLMRRLVDRRFPPRNEFSLEMVQWNRTWSERSVVVHDGECWLGEPMMRQIHRSTERPKDLRRWGWLEDVLGSLVRLPAHRANDAGERPEVEPLEGELLVEVALWSAIGETPPFLSLDPIWLPWAREQLLPEAR